MTCNPTRSFENPYLAESSVTFLNTYSDEYSDEYSSNRIVSDRASSVIDIETCGTQGKLEII